MTTTIGGITVFLTDDTERFQTSMRQNAALVEQQSNRMSKALGGAAKSVDELNRRSSNFNPDGFRALAISALRAEDAVKRLELSFYAAGAALGGGFLGTAAARALADYADTFTNIRNRVAAVTSTRTQQLAAEREIFAVAERSRASVQSTATIYARIASSSPELAKNAQNLSRVVETVQKSFQVGGASTQEAQASALQLAQALGSGRLQGDELRSILENNIPLATILAKELSGGNVGALKELGSEGLLTTEKVIQAILKGSAEIDASFAKTTARIADGFTGLNNAVTRFVGQTDQAFGVSSGLANGLLSLAKNFDSVADAAVLAGLAIAGAFVGRKVGAGAAALQGSVDNARLNALASKDAADGIVKQAQERAAKAALSSQISSAVADDFRSLPRLQQADPSIIKAREAAIAKEDAAHQKLAKSIDKEAESYVKLADAANISTGASATAQKRLDSAIKAQTENQAKLSKLDEKRAGLQAKFDVAGGDVRRSELSKFYAALAKEVDARTALADSRAAVALNEANIAALQRAEVVARSRKDFEFLAGIKSRQAEEQGRTQQLVNEQILAGNALRKAEEETARQNADIQRRQLSDKERVAVQLARVDADRQAQQARIQRGDQAIAAAQQAIADSAVKSEEQKQAQIARIQNQALADRQARVKAQEAADFTTQQRRAIETQIPLSANANQARVLKDAVDSANALRVANEAAFQAQQAQAAAARASSAPMVALTSTMNGLRATAVGLWSFLGGPFGAIFTTAGIAVGAFAAAQAEAARKAAEYRDILESLPAAIEKLTQATRSGIAASAAEVIDAQASLQKLREGQRQAIASLLEQGGVTTGKGFFSNVKSSLAQFDAITGQSDLGKLRNAFSGAGDDLNKYLLQLREAGDDTDKTKQATEDFIAALDRVSGSNPNLSGVIKAFRDAASEILRAIGAINAFDAAVTGRTVRQNNIRSVYDQDANLRNLPLPPEITAAQAGQNFTDQLNRGTLPSQEAVNEAALRRTLNSQLPPEVPDPSTGELGRLVGKGILQREIAAAKTKKKDRTPSQAEINAERDKAFAAGGFLSVEDATRIAAARLTGSGGGGGGRKGKTPEQTFEDKLARLTEVGRASFFSDSDRELVEKLVALKADPKLVQRTTDALQNRTELPDQAKQVQRALDLEKAGRAYNELITKYGTLEQLAPKFEEKQRVLNIAVEQGAISAQQAALAYGEYVASFQQNQWINSLSDAFGSFVDKVATGSAKIKDAFKDLLKDLVKIAVNQLLTVPLKNSLTTLLGSFIGGSPGQSSGGGIFSSLISGLFGSFGGGSSLYGTTSAAAVKFHGGGRVGYGGTPTTVPLSALSGNIPRYHTGLKTDEMLAVLQKNERVLTQQQEARTMNLIDGLGQAAEGGGGGITVVQHNSFAAGTDAAAIAKLLPAAKQAALDGVREALARGKL